MSFRAGRQSHVTELGGRSHCFHGLGMSWRPKSRVFHGNCILSDTAFQAVDS